MSAGFVTLDQIADRLVSEAEIADRDDVPEHRKTWGWGANPETLKRSRTKASKVGTLCSSCEDRFLPGMEVVA